MVGRIWCSASKNQLLKSQQREFCTRFFWAALIERTGESSQLFSFLLLFCPQQNDHLFLVSKKIILFFQKKNKNYYYK
jgi:hypothetical protein